MKKELDKNLANSSDALGDIFCDDWTGEIVLGDPIESSTPKKN